MFLFCDIIRKLPNSEITISVNDKNLLVIECEGSLYKLSTLKAEEFPTLPTINVEKSISIESKMLKELIKRTIFAISLEENRPVFTGSLFEVKDNKIRVKEEVSPRHLCSKEGYSDVIVCLPNKIIVKVNRKDNQIDGVVK